MPVYTKLIRYHHTNATRCTITCIYINLLHDSVRWCSNYTPTLSQKVKTTTTQANCCLELFIWVVWRSPRAGKASVPNNRRKGCRCRGGEKGELASTGTVTNYNTIGTCEKNRPRRTAYLAEPSQIWKAKQTKVTYVLTLGLRRYLNMIGEGLETKWVCRLTGLSITKDMYLTSSVPEF